MKREYAEAIVAGSKTVEYREFKPHYSRRILDKNVLAWSDENDARLSDGDIAYVDPMRQVQSIHFYDYNGTWYLDVSVKETGLVSYTEDDVRYLNELGSHEMDEGLEYFSAHGTPENERPVYFYFAIEGIISSNL